MKSIGKLNLALDLLYLWHNPYRVSKKHLLKRGEEDIYQYGETPLETAYQIGIEAEVTEKDHLFELGCGRGLVSFFFMKQFGCRVTGIDEVPLFIKKAKQIDTFFSLGCSFLCEDFFESDLSAATVIYLYGTCLPDEAIHKLCDLFLPHQRIISVSYPLSDYNSDFKVLKKFDLAYPWGETEGYICQRQQ